MKVQIVLMSCITLLLASCVQTNEHGIFRSEDMITLYWVLQENAEIANFELKIFIMYFRIDKVRVNIK